MPWSDFIGNAAAVEAARGMVAAGQADRTLVISGPRGVGKTTFAVLLGLALNCQTPPAAGDSCGQCASCRAVVPLEREPALIEEALEFREREVKGAVREAAPLSVALHPHIRLYPPDGEFFSMPQARALMRRTQWLPDAGQCECLVVPDFDQARWMTQTALLKTLEEPPARVALILLARNPLTLLPTVRSRARMLALAPLPPEALAAALAARGGLDEPELRAHLAQGCPGLALRLDLEAYRELRRTALALVRAAAGAAEAGVLFRASESVRAGKEKFETLIEILYSVLQDIQYLQSGYSEAVRNRDCLTELAPMAATLCADKIPQAIEGIDRIQSAARRNVNRPLALDAWALELAGGGRR